MVRAVLALFVSTLVATDPCLAQSGAAPPAGATLPPASRPRHAIGNPRLTASAKNGTSER